MRYEMKPAPIPVDEEQRLRALQRYKVLDTNPETTFDEITSLAAKICESKIALVSLVDGNRQWFKSKFGLTAQETPRDISYCGHAIMSDEIFEITDSEKNIDFCDNPLFLGEPHVRFYAGAPLVTPEGFRIGTLCVIDPIARKLTETQRALLKSLAKHVVALLELKKSNEILDSSRILSNQMQKIAKIGGWEYDFVSQELVWTQGHYEIFGIPEGQPPNKLFNLYKDKIHPGDHAVLDKVMKEAAGLGKDFRYEHRVLVGSGLAEKLVEGKGKIVRDSKGKPIKMYGTCQDITEKKSLEKKLEYERVKSAQAARLTSLGEMCSGIAHEINNPLTIILGTLNLIKRYKNDETKFENKLQVVQSSCERISKIVVGLKKFARSSNERVRRNEKISTICEEVISLAYYRAHRFSIPLSVECNANISIECDPVEIEQALLSLVNNSIDALKDRDSKWIRIEGFENQDQVGIRVVDSGVGIDPKVREKIFDPFFTTKSVGESTGLGLSITRGILEDHGASISYDERSGNTCFEILFPKIKQKLAA